MSDIQTAFAQPGVGLLAMFIIGAIAGWIAEQVTRSDHGIFTNILVGIAGAFVGGMIAELLQIPIVGFWRTLIAATLGAILILFVWRLRPGQQTQT
jgi:uncharacterized membrane protein YeaQ/YmgE (transglycosylase-associated protein family)